MDEINEEEEFAWKQLERFAELVRQDERKKCAADYSQDCANAIEKARLEEKEECAKLCEAIGQHELITMCAAAIRGERNEI